MTNEEQAQKIRYLRFSEKFEREEAIKALKKVKEPSVYTGRIYYSYYMDLLAVALKYGGAIPLKGSQYGYDSPAAEVASMIDAQDTEIPQIGFALMAMSQMGLITVQQDDGQQMAITFSLVWQYTRQITAGAADKEERSGKPSGLEIPGAPVRDFPTVSGGQEPLPGPTAAPKSEKKKKKLSKKDQEAEELFERLWRQYPNKLGKDKVSMATKRRLLEAGEEKCRRYLDRHNAQMAGKDKNWIPYGSTFFNSRIWEMMENDEQAKQQPGQGFSQYMAPPVTPVNDDTIWNTILKEGIYKMATYTWNRARFEEVRPKLSSEMAAAIEAKMG